MKVRTFLRRDRLQVDVFFCFLTNSIFLKNNYSWLKINIFFKSFFIYTVHKVNLFVVKFFCNFLNCWNLFWQFTSFCNKNLFGFFFELELIGLGFRIRKILPNIYRFFWGRSNYLYLFASSRVIVEYLVEERLIYFFSFDGKHLGDIVSFLMILRKLSSYRVTGFIKPGSIIRLNSGKRR